jgi:hypothetical protein
MITIGLSGGGSAVETLTGNSGTASPSSNNINVVTANTTVQFVGSGSTLTEDFGANTNLLIGTAGPSISGATNNTSLGYQAFTGVISATQCVAIGFESMQGANSGSYNTAVGSQSLKAMATGSQNVGIGLSAGAVLINGSNDVFVGYNAGAQFPHGSNNTMVGSLAGSNLLGSSSNNTLIGYNAGSAYVLNENNNIILGENIAGTVSENNVIRIGNSSNAACYITGIDGVNVGSIAKVVTEASNQLGTATITAGTGITVTPTANTITIAATPQNLTFTVVTHASSPYTVLAADQFLEVDTTGGAVSILLPNAPTTGRVIYIKDYKGNASTTNILVTTVGGSVTIDGQTTYTMASNWSGLILTFDSTSYYII